MVAHMVPASRRYRAPCARVPRDLANLVSAKCRAGISSGCTRKAGRALACVGTRRNAGAGGGFCAARRIMQRKLAQLAGRRNVWRGRPQVGSNKRPVKMGQAQGGLIAALQVARVLWQCCRNGNARLGLHKGVAVCRIVEHDSSRVVDTSDTWIIERTGIKERRILKGEGLGTSHMGAEAVRGLLDRTATKPQEIDLLICATTTPDFVFPSTANIICDMVGVKDIGSFDVQAACSGFLYALTIASQFVANGQCRKVVVS